MNKKQARWRILELLRRKPNISQHGRLITHLLMELGACQQELIPGGQKVEQALYDLEADGQVLLGRSGSVLNEVRLLDQDGNPARSLPEDEAKSRDSP